VYPLQALASAEGQLLAVLAGGRNRCLIGTPLRQQGQRVPVVAVQCQQQGGCPLRMRWPVHVQQDHRLLIRLGHDGVQVKFRPVERRDGRWHGELVRKVVRVQVADMHQAGSPGQPGRDEHCYARERGREYHVPTLTRAGLRRNQQFAVGSSHGYRGSLAWLAVENA
jgi:hypothetical protein